MHVCMRVMCEIERWYFIGAEIACEGRTKDGSLWDPKQAKQTKQTKQHSYKQAAQAGQ